MPSSQPVPFVAHPLAATRNQKSGVEIFRGHVCKSAICPISLLPACSANAAAGWRHSREPSAATNVNLPYLGAIGEAIDPHHRPSFIQHSVLSSPVVIVVISRRQSSTSFVVVSRCGRHPVVILGPGFAGAPPRARDRTQAMGRKRRVRASASAAPTPESTTNSLATSSPSSHRNSRSDDNESDLAAGGGSASVAAGGGGGGGGTRAKRLSADPLTSPDVDNAHLPGKSLHPHSQPLPHLSATAHAHSQSSAHALRGAHASASASAGPAASSPSSQTGVAAGVASAAPIQDAGAVIMAASTAAAQSVPTDDPTRFSVASVALRLYEQLIDWAVLQFAVQYKHHVYLTTEERRRAGAFPSTGQRSSSRISIVHGSCGSSLIFSDKSVTVDCSHCGTSTAASRYALHVEKCLGLGGRMSSRTASQRLRSAAERADKDAAADMDDIPTRRRRHSSAASASDHDGGSVSVSHASHKRRKMSPLTSGGSVSVGHGSNNSRGLPPSGRTRASPK